MTETESAEIFARIGKVEGAFEVRRVVETFVFHRETAAGVQDVTVQVFDAGENANPMLGYSVFATANDGRTATGNPDRSIDLALRMVHWHDLGE